MRINHILPGKKIVWVNDDRMYLKGKDYKILKKETWESSLYASVYKYSHDIFPAKASLGTNGCTDCHSFSSDLFYRQIVKYPFGEDGNHLTEPQFKRLNMSGFMIGLSAFREQFVKSFEYPAIIFLILAVISGILMMIKFELIYQIVRVAYTVFDISVVLSVVISIIYLIIDQFAILKTDVQK